MGNQSLKNSHTSNNALGFQPNQTYPPVIPNVQNTQQIPPGYVPASYVPYIQGDIQMLAAQNQPFKKKSGFEEVINIASSKVSKMSKTKSKRSKKHKKNKRSTSSSSSSSSSSSNSDSD